jgi:hypothetical protein
MCRPSLNASLSFRFRWNCFRICAHVCATHQKMMDYLKQLHDDSEEVEVTYMAVCEETKEKQ